MLGIHRRHLSRVWVAAFAYALLQDLFVYGPAGILFYRYYAPLHIRWRVRNGWKAAAPHRKPNALRFTIVQPRGQWWSTDGPFGAKNARILYAAPRYWVCTVSGREHSAASADVMSLQNCSRRSHSAGDAADIVAMGPPFSCPPRRMLDTL
jgi:hypothetical protein